VRQAPLTDPAREALVPLPVEGEFCFAPIRGEHWTTSARAYRWKAVRAAAGWEASLYRRASRRCSSALTLECRRRTQVRAGDFYVILAIDRHKEFAALIERSEARAERYEVPLKDDKP
jgi:hypothetical protein